MQQNLAYQVNAGAGDATRQGFDSATSYFSKQDSDDNIASRVRSEIDTHLEPQIRDVAYDMADSLTSAIYDAAEQQGQPTRREALDYFERNFWTEGVDRTIGNISKLGRESGIAPKNIYPKLKRYELMPLVNHKRPEVQAPLENKLYTGGTGAGITASQVQDTLTSTLSGYREKLHPTMYAEIDSRIKERSEAIAANVADYMPTPEKRLETIFDNTRGVTDYRQAKAMFEKQIVYDALSAAGFDKKKAAKYLGDDIRTLNRKIKEFCLDEENVARMDDFIRKKNSKDGLTEERASEVGRPAGAVDEIERFHEIVREYNSKREAERKRQSRLQRAKGLNKQQS